MGKTLDFTVSCGLAPTGGELRNTQYQPQLQKTVSFSSVAPPFSFWDLLDLLCCFPAFSDCRIPKVGCTIQAAQRQAVINTPQESESTENNTQQDREETRHIQKVNDFFFGSRTQKLPQTFEVCSRVRESVLRLLSELSWNQTMPRDEGNPGELLLFAQCKMKETAERGRKQRDCRVPAVLENQYQATEHHTGHDTQIWRTSQDRRKQATLRVKKTTTSGLRLQHLQLFKLLQIYFLLRCGWLSDL